MNHRGVVLGIILTVLAAACGGGSSYSSTPSSPTPTPTPAPAGTPVAIVGGASTRGAQAYAPSPLTVPMGTTVTWTNDDTVAHTATADGGAWNSGSIAPGGRFSATLNQAGTFPYHCTIHPGMAGTVTVQ